MKNKHLEKAERLLLDAHRFAKEAQDYADIAEKHAKDAADQYKALKKSEQRYKDGIALEKQLNDILEVK
jgi:hypothetical protein